MSSTKQTSSINDRIPGMPLLGFFTGTVLSLAIWGAVAVLALTV